MKYYQLFNFVFVGLMLSSCANQPGNNKAYQAYSNKCSDAFISDYNALVYDAKAVYSVESLNRFESAVNNFEQTYKDVVCEAINTESYSKDTISVNVGEVVQNYRNAIRQTRASLK